MDKKRTKRIKKLLDYKFTEKDVGKKIADFEWYQKVKKYIEDLKKECENKK